jgi:adenine deaminase
VPATTFESSGALLGLPETEELLKMDDILYLSEMMNFPGVLSDDPLVMDKIALAKKYGRKIDGHAPGLMGEAAKKYISAGISTDHECFSIEEAIDKIGSGMHILIREGSAARNFDDLIPLLSRYPEKLMFCSDDKHPDDLVRGHMNLLARRAVALGYAPLQFLRSAILNPVRHYGLNVGLLQPGDDADFIVVNNLNEFGVMKTFVGGRLVAENGRTNILPVEESRPNNFVAEKITPADIVVKAEGNTLRVQRALDGQLITEEVTMAPSVSDGCVVSDPVRDMLKMVVLNRYTKTPPAVSFVNNFGLKQGAIASTVAHDSHNIIAVGADDQMICRAINLLIDARGGICAVGEEGFVLLPLPVAGIMSADDGHSVARKYEQADRMAKDLGSGLQAPFMTLSFMALLVIPSIKLSDKGLFDGIKFEFVSMFKN